MSVLNWGLDGYRLWVGQTGRAKEIWELKFVKSLAGRNRVYHVSDKGGASEPSLEEIYILQGDDRLLLISEMPAPTDDSSRIDASLLARYSGSQLIVRHVLAPQEYITDNWPIKTTAVSSDGSEIVVAGSRGLALYNRSGDKWRLFGDVNQERALSVCLLGWMDRVIVTCSVEKGSSELILFPNYHLDFGSALVRHQLERAPVALDCLDHYVLIASEPLNITLFECVIFGELSKSTKATASLVPVRDLSIMSLERPLIIVSLTHTPDSHSKVILAAF